MTPNHWATRPGPGSFTDLPKLASAGGTAAALNKQAFLLTTLPVLKHITPLKPKTAQDSISMGPLDLLLPVFPADHVLLRTR